MLFEKTKENLKKRWFLQDVFSISVYNKKVILINLVKTIKISQNRLLFA